MPTLDPDLTEDVAQADSQEVYPKKNWRTRKTPDASTRPAPLVDPQAEPETDVGANHAATHAALQQQQQQLEENRLKARHTDRVTHGMSPQAYHDFHKQLPHLDNAEAVKYSLLNEPFLAKAFGVSVEDIGADYDVMADLYVQQRYGIPHLDPKALYLRIGDEYEVEERLLTVAAHNDAIPVVESEGNRPLNVRRIFKEKVGGKEIWRIAGAWQITDLPELFANPAFQEASHEERRWLLQQALVSAYDQQTRATPHFGKKEYRPFMEAVKAAYAGLDEMDSLGAKTGRFLSKTWSVVEHFGKDLGTIGYVAANPLNSELNYTFNKGVVEGVNDWYQAGKEAVARSGRPERELQTALDAFRIEIQDGDIPFDDREQFDAWLQLKSDLFKNRQAEIYADVETLGTRLNPFSYPEPDGSHKAAAKGLLDDPEALFLVGAYIKTQDPEIWSRLEQHLFETPGVKAARAAKEKLLETPGAKKFDEVFGAGASQHLISASDPVAIAGLALPFMRAGGIVAAGNKTTGALNTARIIAASTLKSAPEMAAFGAAEQLRQNPQSSLSQIGASALDSAATGTFISGVAGTTGVGIKKGVEAIQPAAPRSLLKAGTALPAAPGTSPPREHGLIKGSKLDQWADKVLAKSRGNVNAEIDPVVGSAVAVKSAVLIENGIRTFAEWSQQMIKEFGESIRPQLDDLWKRANEELQVLRPPFNHDEGTAITMGGTATPITSGRKRRRRGRNFTSRGTVRKNARDWRSTRDLWDVTGYGGLLSRANRKLIGKGLIPIVDDAWIALNPEDAGLRGEKISMHHVKGLPISVPLPKSRHLDAHMPGGFRYNAGGTGSQLPIYPAN